MKVNMRLLCFLLGICAMALTSCATTTLTALYDTGTEKLVWSARSETQLNESDGSLIKLFVKVAIDRLVADKIIR